MTKYKKPELELSPHLLKKLLEHVKSPQVAPEDINWMVDNVIYLSKCDEMLTLDEYELIIKKPTVM